MILSARPNRCKPVDFIEKYNTRTHLLLNEKNKPLLALSLTIRNTRIAQSDWSKILDFFQKFFRISRKWSTVI